MTPRTEAKIEIVREDGSGWCHGLVDGRKVCQGYDAAALRRYCEAWGEPGGPGERAAETARLERAWREARERERALPAEEVEALGSAAAKAERDAHRELLAYVDEPPRPWWTGMSLPPSSRPSRSGPGAPEESPLESPLESAAEEPLEEQADGPESAG